MLIRYGGADQRRALLPQAAPVVDDAIRRQFLSGTAAGLLGWEWLADDPERLFLSEGPG